MVDVKRSTLEHNHVENQEVFFFLSASEHVLDINAFMDIDINA